MQAQLLQSFSAPLLKFAYLEKKNTLGPMPKYFCAKNTNLQWYPAFQEDTECFDTNKENNHIPLEEWILLPAKK